MLKYFIKYIKKYFTSTSPSQVLSAVLKRDLTWIDYEKLTFEEQKLYYIKIQQVLNNDAFQNEIRYLLADWVSELAQTDPDPDIDKPLRWSINGLELLLERLRSIENPVINEPSKENIYDDV